MAEKTVKVVVAYHPTDKASVGTVKEIPVSDYRVLSREGRVRMFDPDVDVDPAAVTPAVVPAAVETAAAQPKTATRARPNGAEGDGQ